jgi:hypothetical protein
LDRESIEAPLLLAVSGRQSIDLRGIFSSAVRTPEPAKYHYTLAHNDLHQKPIAQKKFEKPWKNSCPFRVPPVMRPICPNQNKTVPARIRIWPLASTPGTRAANVKDHSREKEALVDATIRCPSIA